jgi:hypothetical protein
MKYGIFLLSDAFLIYGICLQQKMHAASIYGVGLKYFEPNLYINKNTNILQVTS